MSPIQAAADLWVVDCSAFMPLVLSDEGAEVAENLLRRAAQGSVRLTVPPLFWYEVGNVLCVAVARKRLTPDDSEGALYRMTGLPMETDQELSAVTVLRMGRLSALHGLTMYDAAYVELAERRAAHLLTRDKKLLALNAVYPWIRSSC